MGTADNRNVTQQPVSQSKVRLAMEKQGVPDLATPCLVIKLLKIF
jgi:hypothetical protein